MADLPQIAIVGFPNVGKSTLFNQLARRRNSLVHSLPGMTRDRVSADVRLQDARGRAHRHGRVHRRAAGRAPGRPGPRDGLGGGPSGRRRPPPPRRAPRPASGRGGPVPPLQKLDKPLVVAVNKIDTDRPGPEAAEFYRLGEKTLHFISAEHNRSTSTPWSRPWSTLLPASGAEEAGAADRPLRIAVIGRTNVGKSSLINRLCGEERLIVTRAAGHDPRQRRRPDPPRRQGLSSWSTRPGSASCPRPATSASRPGSSSRARTSIWPTSSASLLDALRVSRPGRTRRWPSWPWNRASP